TKIRYRRSPGRKTSRSGSVIGRYALSRNTIQIGSTATTWWSANSRRAQDALGGVSKDLGAEHDVFLIGVLGPVMADAAEARDEHHHGRHAVGQDRRVVARRTRQPHMHAR